MERKQFTVTLINLWKHLGLGEPDLRDDRDITLSIDAFDIALRDGEDGRTLVLEADAGRLSSRSDVALMELEKVLKTNLALTASRDTIAVLDDAGGMDSETASRVLVRGFYRYDRNDLAKLSDLLSDVVSSAETLQALLTDADSMQRPALAHSDNRTTGADDMMIFKP